jgi:hypothetical protein
MAGLEEKGEYRLFETGRYAGDIKIKCKIYYFF